MYATLIYIFIFKSWHLNLLHNVNNYILKTKNKTDKKNKEKKYPIGKGINEGQVM